MWHTWRFLSLLAAAGATTAGHRALETPRIRANGQAPLEAKQSLETRLHKQSGRKTRRHTIGNSDEVLQIVAAQTEFDRLLAHPATRGFSSLVIAHVGWICGNAALQCSVVDGLQMSGRSQQPETLRLPQVIPAPLQLSPLAIFVEDSTEEAVSNTVFHNWDARDGWLLLHGFAKRYGLQLMAAKHTNTAATGVADASHSKTSRRLTQQGINHIQGQGNKPAVNKLESFGKRSAKRRSAGSSVQGPVPLADMPNARFRSQGASNASVSGTLLYTVGCWSTVRARPTPAAASAQAGAAPRPRDAAPEARADVFYVDGSAARGGFNAAHKTMLTLAHNAVCAEPAADALPEFPPAGSPTPQPAHIPLYAGTPIFTDSLDADGVPTGKEKRGSLGLTVKVTVHVLEAAPRDWPRPVTRCTHTYGITSAHNVLSTSEKDSLPLAIAASGLPAAFPWHNRVVSSRRVGFTKPARMPSGSQWFVAAYDDHTVGLAQPNRGVVGHVVGASALLTSPATADFFRDVSPRQPADPDADTGPAIATLAFEDWVARLPVSTPPPSPSPSQSVSSTPTVSPSPAEPAAAARRDLMRELLDVAAPLRVVTDVAAIRLANTTRAATACIPAPWGPVVLYATPESAEATQLVDLARPAWLDCSRTLAGGCAVTPDSTAGGVTRAFDQAVGIDATASLPDALADAGLDRRAAARLVLQHVRRRTLVLKVGSSTGTTRGTIEGYGRVVPLYPIDTSPTDRGLLAQAYARRGMGMLLVAAANPDEWGSVMRTTFGTHGDSGALVVTAGGGAPVGLLTELVRRDSLRVGWLYSCLQTHTLTAIIPTSVALELTMPAVMEDAVRECRRPAPLPATDPLVYAPSRRSQHYYSAAQHWRTPSSTPSPPILLSAGAGAGVNHGARTLDAGAGAGVGRDVRALDADARAVAPQRPRNVALRASHAQATAYIDQNEPRTIVVEIAGVQAATVGRLVVRCTTLWANPALPVPLVADASALNALLEALLPHAVRLCRQKATEPVPGATDAAIGPMATPAAGYVPMAVVMAEICTE